MAAQANAREVLTNAYKEALKQPEWCDKAWLYAQVLTRLLAPDLAAKLRDVRTRAMLEIQIQLRSEERPQPVGYRRFQFTRDTNNRSRADRWKLIDITPEVSIDPQMHGLKVSPGLVKQLRKLIREQIWLLKQFES